MGALVSCFPFHIILFASHNVHTVLNYYGSADQNSPLSATIKLEISLELITKCTCFDYCIMKLGKKKKETWTCTCIYVHALIPFVRLKCELVETHARTSYPSNHFSCRFSILYFNPT